MSKALILTEISRILSSDHLFLTPQGKQEFLAELFLIKKDGSFFGDMPTYTKDSVDQCQILASENNIPLTCNYSEPNIDNPAIAYYRIKGMIMGESRYWFSTKQFNEDLIAAEANPMIMSHFLHVNSGGGDTWYLDVAFKTMMSLKKPCVTVVERVGASAAVYLFCASKKIYAATLNETLGSLGTMVSLYNWDGYLEKEGIKLIEEYASKSDLKNKKFKDLKDGKPEQFIKEELDPLRDQFIESVRKARSKIGALEETHPLLRGETFSTSAAIDLGLIDGQKTFTESINEAYKLGLNYMNRKNATDNAINYLNNL